MSLRGSKSQSLHLKKNIMIVILACIVGFCLGKFFVQVIVCMILLLAFIAKMLLKSILTISKIALRMIGFIYSKVSKYYQKNKFIIAEIRSFSL